MDREEVFSHKGDQSTDGNPAFRAVTNAKIEDASSKSLNESGTGTTVYLWKIHDYVNNYIRFSDTKAGLAIAVESAVLGALFKMKAHEAFVNIPMRSWGAASWLTVACFFSLGAAMATGAWSVWPRLSNPQPKGYPFWEAILAHSSAESFWGHFREESTESLAEHLAHHVFVLSGICQRKFHWVGWCIRFGIVGAVLSGMLLLIL